MVREVLAERIVELATMVEVDPVCRREAAPVG
jgi:hypothetical protein